VRGDADGAEGDCCAVVGTEELGWSSCGHSRIIVLRFFLESEAEHGFARMIRITA
jgi:hypothetical protein